MITREEILTFPDRSFPDSICLNDAVFYDIETTGLGWRSSHVYLIGVLFRSEGTWRLRQWFLDRPFAEKDMLASFMEFLSSLDRYVLTDYNGSTFDLPYLKNKLLYYKMPVPDVFLESSSPCHQDLLQMIRPLKSKLPLGSLRLQDVEKLLHTPRKDHSSGKDLIDVYYSFLKTGEPHLLDQLFLHNRDDVAALPSVASLYCAVDFWNGKFTPSLQEIQQDHVQFRLALPAPFPVSFTMEGQDLSGMFSGTPGTHIPSCMITFRDTAAFLKVPVFDQECRLYFPNYREYYYLPGEDRAIHKSVGVFTDPAFREQAKASTCYQRVHSQFLPYIPGTEIPGIHPFYREYKDKLAWIRKDDLLKCSEKEIFAYVKGVLRNFF